MKVAIIGAGASGLSCALELERQGIMPDIFEERRLAGELFNHFVVILQLMNRPVRDSLDYLKKEFSIDLKPLSPVEKVIMNAPKSQGVVTGRLGYTLELGQTPGSVTSQLLSGLKAQVRYNVRADYRELAGEYDYVVVASGHHNVPKELGCWSDLYKTWVYGSEVLGELDPKALIMWLNKEYAGSAYAYLSCRDSSSGSLVLVVPNANENNIKHYWKKFWQLEKPDYQVVDEWTLEHVSGFVYPHQVGNILFVGNAGGFLEPFLGFALMAAIKSGVLAARHIAGGKDYEEALYHLKQNSSYSRALRKVLDGFQNSDFDHLVSLAATPGIMQLIYQTNIDTMKYSGVLADSLDVLRKIFKRDVSPQI